MNAIAGASQRATRALIDLDAIEGNVQAVLKRVPPGVAVMAVVKANAYGHGARMTADAALAAGAARLGVATLDEALVLRRHGIDAPIQILGPVLAAEAIEAARHSIEISAGSIEFIEDLTNVKFDRPLPVHLKIDTGLHRFGVTPAVAVAAMSKLASIPDVRIAGVFTHFGQADETGEGPTALQTAGFSEAVKTIRAAGLPTGLVHAANSAGLLRSREFDFDLVRLGIALYGIAPSSDIGLAAGMRPAMTLVSRIQRVFDLVTGDGVSYGATFRADGPMRAGLVPIGYGDGYLRALSNRGVMAIGEHEAKVLGRVCMDQTVVQLATGVDVVVNSEVIIFGGSPPKGIPVERVAALAGTNSYEIVTAVSARVPRIFMRGGELIAVEDLGGLHRLS